MTRRAQLTLLAVGVAAFGLLVWQAGPATLLAQIRQSGWVVVPTILVYGMVYLFNSEAWRLTMHERPPLIPSARSYAITVWAFALNYLTPMVSVGGEPFKIAAASPWLGTRGATASVLGERLLHMQGHLLFFLTGIVLAIVYLPRTTIGMLPLILVALVLAVVGYMSLVPHRRGGALALLHLLERLPIPRRWKRWLAGRHDAAREVDTQLTAFYNDSPRRYVGALALEYAGRCLSVLELLLIANAIGVPVTYGVAFLIASFASFAVNIAFFLPFGLGAREGGLYAIFGLLGMPPELGVAASMLGRIRELAWIGLGLALGAVGVGIGKGPGTGEE